MAKYKAETDKKFSKLHNAVMRLTIALNEISSGKQNFMTHSDILCDYLKLDNAPVISMDGEDTSESTTSMNGRRAFVPSRPKPPVLTSSGTHLLVDSTILAQMFDFLGQGEGLFVIGVNHTWKYLYCKSMGGDVVSTSPLAALKSISRLEFAHANGLNVSILSVRVSDKARPLAWFAGRLAGSDVCVRLAELAGNDTCKTHIASGAASDGRLGILKDLIENYKWKFGASVLYRAAEAPTLDVLNWLYDQRIGSWDEEDKGKCLLHAVVILQMPNFCLMWGVNGTNIP